MARGVSRTNVSEQVDLSRQVPSPEGGRRSPGEQKSYEPRIKASRHLLLLKSATGGLHCCLAGVARVGQPIAVGHRRILLAQAERSSDRRDVGAARIRSNSTLLIATSDARAGVAMR